MYRFAATLLFAIACALPGRAADPLTAHLPDDAWLVVSVPDSALSRKHWDGSLVRDVMADAQMAAFLKPLLDLLGLAGGDATGVAAPLLANLHGGMAVALTDFDGYFVGMRTLAQRRAENPEAAIALPRHWLGIAEIGANAEAVRTYMASYADQAADRAWAANPDATLTVTREIHQGVDLTLLTTRVNDQDTAEFAWGIRDGVMVCGSPTLRVRGLLDSLADGPAESNASTIPAYTRALDTMGRHDALAVLNTQVLGGAIEILLREWLAPGGQPRPGPMGLKVDGLVKALDLHAWRYVALSLDLSQRDPTLALGLGWQEPLGIIRAAARFDGAAPRPTWIPADAETAVTVHVDVKGLVNDILTSLTMASSTIGAFARLAIIDAGTQMGINTQIDVINVLGPEWIQLQRHARVPDGVVDAQAVLAAGGSVQLLSLQPGTNMAATLATVATAYDQANAANGDPPIPTRQIGDTVVYAQELPARNGGKSGTLELCAHGGYLLIGMNAGDFLDTVIGWLDTPPATSIWDDPTVRAALASLPADPDGLTVSDMADLLNSNAELLPFLARTGGPAAFLGSMLNLQAIPVPATVNRYFHLVVGATYVRPDDMVLRLRLISPQPTATDAVPPADPPPAAPAIP